MAQYRNSLPQLSGRLFLTDGGIETSLIFHDGFDLPCFAAYDLLRHEAGIEALRRYYRRHAEIARSNGVGFILESPTWRANPDWGLRMGHSADELAILNRRAIELMSEIRSAFQTDDTPMVISGCIGPRGDGYAPGRTMTPAEAEAYHAVQIGTFCETDADMVTALTMTHAGEAIGITRAAQRAGMPVAISFTLETDGRLPSGPPLGDAITEVDEASGRGPSDAF
jgi:S-methylmethionine-dependent homocysteine/selenocysteine methylase